MNVYLNYLIEANISLLLFFAAYGLLLRRETDFSMKRLFLICGIGAAVLFPLLHVHFGSSAVPSLKNFLPTYMLPEFSVTADGQQPLTVPGFDGFSIWSTFRTIYVSGAVLFLAIFIFRIADLVRVMRHSVPAAAGKFRIIESVADRPPFSFFNFIFLGQASRLSPDEKDKIIRHEMVHARQLHSFDILLVNFLSILFWFNPIIGLYKRAFIQLHEFEADAKAINGSEVNDYCALLAKVALLSADLKLASHFSNSLTVKRIEMMRTMKQKVKVWKIAAVAAIIPLVFFIVACQDQMIDDLTEIAKDTSNALIVPDDIQARFDALKKAHPGSKYILVEFGDQADAKLAAMEEKYGVPKSIELYTPDAGPVVGKASGVIIESTKASIKTYAIIEYNSLNKNLSELSKNADGVYSIVEETASPVGGLGSFYEFLSLKIFYPKAAREKGLEGKVFVEFIVQTDGALSDFKILKGIGPDLDQEALRVVKIAPPWNPGKVDGRPVKQRMVVPIDFRLGSKKSAESQDPKDLMPEIIVTSSPIKK